MTQRSKARRRDVIAFYDRFGARQDRQGWYEHPPLERLLAVGRFDEARSVCEFGCGTGRLAARLLDSLLPTDARYLALDASATMAALAEARLGPWRPRATVHRTDGSLRVPGPDSAWERFLCAYLLDLLPAEDAAAMLEEAARVVPPGGLLCVVGLTPGDGLVSGAVSRLWSALHALNWRWVGNCRPLRVTPLLNAHHWRVLHDETIAAWGIASQVLVVERI